MPLQVHDINAFGYSWMLDIDDSEECLEDCDNPEPPPECTDDQKKKAEQECGLLTQNSAVQVLSHSNQSPAITRYASHTWSPPQECIDSLPAETFQTIFEECVADVCHEYGDPMVVTCGYAQLLIELCQERNDEIIEWRTKKFCREYPTLHSFV